MYHRTSLSESLQFRGYYINKPHIAHLDEILGLQKKISEINEAYWSNCHLDPTNAQNDTHMIRKYKLKVVYIHWREQSVPSDF